MKGLRAIAIACLFVLAPVGSTATDCQRLEQQRERLERELRRGYSIQRGNRLRERLRELDTRIAHDCR